MQGFREGFAYFCSNTGAVLGVDIGEQYVDSVNTSIDDLIESLNQFDGYKTDSSKLQGDLAEFWHAGTFNIDAAVKDTGSRAYVNRSHDFASADISTNHGDKYGLKYYKNAALSAKAQSKSVFERFKQYQAQGGKDSLDKFLEDRGYNNIDSILNDPIYTGQKRLIPKDQLVEATEWLKRKIAKEACARPEQVKRYQETLDLLTDRIKDSKGSESIPLSREDAQRLAELAKQGKVKAEDLGLTTEELITYEYILQQSLKAGLTAATITVVLKIAPEIVKAVKFLIDNEEIDAQQFKTVGFAAISGVSEGFIRGSISAGLTVACKAGLLGQAAKTVSPCAIGMAVVIVMDTMKNAFKVATGKIDRHEMTNALVKETFVASVSLMGGSLLQTILPELPTLGFMLGSFVGSVAGGMLYSVVNNVIISFCIDTGFTMFGLVAQNYTLPEDVMREIGVTVFTPTQFAPSHFEPCRFEPTKFEPSHFSITTFKPYFLRRGVIGIREIGYV